MIATISAWNYGWVEERDTRIKEEREKEQIIENTEEMSKISIQKWKVKTK